MKHRENFDMKFYEAMSETSRSRRADNGSALAALTKSGLSTDPRIDDLLVGVLLRYTALYKSPAGLTKGDIIYHLERGWKIYFAYQLSYLRWLHQFLLRFGYVVAH